MTLAAIAYVAAACAAITGLALRSDPRVLRRLGAARRRPARAPRAAVGRRRPREGWDAVVPDLLDAVAVCIGSGLTPRLALVQAAGVLRGPLAEELARVRRETDLGTPWRSALRAAADRTRLPELRRLAGVFERSERLGSPVAEHLRRLARDVREERRVRHEERARRAPVAMLFPLVLCILPAFVLAAVVPAVLAAARDIR